ncbi:MAG: LacI family transcriptional regulator [Bacteroidales bacterium]|nr:LacI family transcriptional regulator [Bacteroidales bacterium]
MKQKSQDKARIKDIARLAGVSIGTVDRVIHNRGEVAEKTLQRVKKILEDTNYSPNVMAQVLKSRKNYSFVSLLPDPADDNTYWKKHPLGIERALEELQPFPVKLATLTFNMQSEKDFQSKAESVIALKPDGVILAPIFKDESTTFAKKLAAEEIPLVFIDGFIENAPFLAYIGENIFRSGRVAGELLDLLTPPSRDILIVSIARNIKNVHHLEARTQGCLSYFNGNCRNLGKRITLRIPDPSSQSISKAMDGALREHPSISTVFLTGSRTYLLARYLETRGISDLQLVGYDLIEENIDLLRKGIAKFLINQRPDEQTFKAVKKLFEYLSMRKVPDKMEYLPIDIVCSENIDFYI